MHTLVTEMQGPMAAADPAGWAADGHTAGHLPVGFGYLPAPGLDTCMKSLAVRVLGDFGVDGVEPQAIGSRKARLALLLLAPAEGQGVPSDVLVDAPLADAPPAPPRDQPPGVRSRLRSR